MTYKSIIAALPVLYTNIGMLQINLRILTMLMMEMYQLSDDGSGGIADYFRADGSLIFTLLLWFSETATNV